ncbi:MAG: flagellar biosynthesis anti-sigma factor FlgM [Planctomycetaceae bacterium]|nr:flagellar biosynthesis anti-sigma factor FlgM [Planctomycetaceae bacterium]
MRIQGYGEFQQMRKASQKDDAQLKEAAERSEDVENSTSDAVTISPEARRKGKLRMASDFREAKVADVKARLEAGTLVTPESLASGTRKMLEGLVSGEL